MVLLFAIPNLSNATVWITCSPIASQLRAAYGVSSFEVGLCSSSFMVVYLFFNFPADYVLDKYGSKAGIIVGSIFTIIASCCRIFIDHGFKYVIIGQVLGGIGY